MPVLYKPTERKFFDDLYNKNVHGKTFSRYLKNQKSQRQKTINKNRTPFFSSSKRELSFSAPFSRSKRAKPAEISRSKRAKPAEMNTLFSFPSSTRKRKLSLFSK